MKTPRELLLARHQSATPKLDAIRQAVIAGTVGDRTGKNSRPTVWPQRLASSIWHELILPCRPVWTGLAAVWILLIGINVAQRDTTSPPLKPASAQELLITFKIQQRLMAELQSDHGTAPDADRPKSVSPQPRSQSARLFQL